ncbi:MAG: glycosyltransferase family 9 protein, partial [Acidobacteriota bacterium]
MSLARLAPLGRVSGTWFCSLQKGDAASQAISPPPGFQIADFSNDLEDFADTAGLIENLDLVISVDTAVVHLAGTMGKPTWVLLPRVPDWRWLLDRTDSPWYPGLRLFRQAKTGNWESVIGQVAEALRDEVNRRR